MRVRVRGPLRTQIVLSRDDPRECGALMDVCRVAGFLPAVEVEQAETLLAPIVAMLTKMGRR